MLNNLANRSMRLEHDNTDLDRRWSDTLRYLDQTIVAFLFEKPSDMGLNWRLSDGLLTQWAHDFDLAEELKWSLAQGGWNITDLAKNFGEEIGFPFEENRWENAVNNIKEKGYSIEVYASGDVYICQFSIYSGPGLPHGSGMALTFAVIEPDHEKAMRFSERANKMNKILDNEYTKWKFNRLINT
jgi:hypothetical protein